MLRRSLIAVAALAATILVISAFGAAQAAPRQESSAFPVNPSVVWPWQVKAGGTAKYTIKITNTSRQTLPKVDVGFPEDLLLVSSNKSIVKGEGQLKWAISRLAPSKSVVNVVTVVVPAGSAGYSFQFSVAVPGKAAGLNMTFYSKT